jgi:hypothetical protein
MAQNKPDYYYSVAGSDDEEEAGPSTGERKGSPSAYDVERAAASDMQSIAEREHSITEREHSLVWRERRISRLIQFNIIILVISICFFSSRLIIPPPKLSMHKCAKLMSPACEFSVTYLILSIN